MKLSHVPLRLATGAFILNSGLSKRQLPAEGAEGMQSMAANAVPQVKNLEPADFGKALSTGEIALGAMLLTPVVPSWVAGGALTAFSSGLVRMYLKTPGMTAEGSSVKPSEEGTALAKDVWMVGVGLSLLIDGLASKAGKRSA